MPRGARPACQIPLGELDREAGMGLGQGRELQGCF